MYILSGTARTVQIIQSQPLSTYRAPSGQGYVHNKPFLPSKCQFGVFRCYLLVVIAHGMGSVQCTSFQGLLGLSKSSSPSLLGPTWLRQCKETSKKGRFCPSCANFGGFLGLFLAVAVCRMGSLHQESSLGLLGLSKSSSLSLLGPTWLRQCKEMSKKGRFCPWCANFWGFFGAFVVRVTHSMGLGHCPFFQA